MHHESDTAPEAPVTREIATTLDGRDITRGYVNSQYHLYPQDKVLRYRSANSYELYEDLLQDDRVYSTLAQRRSAVVSRESKVVPGGTLRRDRMAAEFIEETLKHIRWDTVTDRMLYGVYYGFSVAEAMWQRDGQHVMLDAVKVRNRRRFVFDQRYQPLLLTIEDPQGEVLPPHKFWSVATGADNDDEPYGRGLAHWLYWPVWFKKNHTKFWLIFLEKFGQPTVQGTYGRGATESEKQKLLQAVQAVRTATGVIMPEDMAISLIEAARSGAVDYQAFYDAMNTSITTVILSETMTTEDGSSQSQAEVHMDVRQDIVEADAALICDSFNRSIVRWLVEWNFPGAMMPRVSRVMDDSATLKSLAERDKIIVDMGHRLDADYIESTYNVVLDKTPMPTPVPMPSATLPSGSELAEGDPDPLEQALDAIDAEDWAALAVPLVQPILDKAIAEPEELLADIAALYPELDTDALEKQLAQLIFVADTWTRLNIDQGDA